MDIGDIVGIKGKVFATKTGENIYPCRRSDTYYLRVLQITSGEIPRTDRYRYTISSEIC